MCLPPPPPPPPAPAQAVNFERSARVGDEIGGHTVSGHVHTTARIVKVTDTENNRRVEFEVRRCGVLAAGGWLDARALRGALPRQPADRPSLCFLSPTLPHPTRLATRLRQLADPTWLKYILPKGFVSVDGCSLTVGEVTPAGFSVYLIPETLRCARACLVTACRGRDAGCSERPGATPQALLCARGHWLCVPGALPVAPGKLCCTQDHGR